VDKKSRGYEQGEINVGQKAETDVKRGSMRWKINLGEQENVRKGNKGVV